MEEGKGRGNGNSFVLVYCAEEDLKHSLIFLTTCIHIEKERGRGEEEEKRREGGEGEEKQRKKQKKKRKNKKSRPNFLLLFTIYRTLFSGPSFGSRR